MTNKHTIVTEDYPENLHGGIMICGINFGYSQVDEETELKDKYDQKEPKSFFSDNSVCNYNFRNRTLKWLKNWGVSLETQAGKEGPFERSFFRTNWIDSQSRDINSDEKIDFKFMVQKENCNGILKLLEERRPKLIILIGISLIEVLNDINIRAEIVQALGNRKGNATFLKPQIPDYTGKKFCAAIQEFEDTKIICLPHTATIGLSDEYVMALKPPEEYMRLLS